MTTRINYFVAIISSLVLVQNLASIVALEPNTASLNQIPGLLGNLYPSNPRPADGAPQGADQRGILWPMVNVDRVENKTKVDVHVP